MNSPKRQSVVLLAALFVALLATVYVLTQEREFAVDLLRAIFGLSGGTTAGG